MEGKRWRRPGKQSMAGIQWIKSNTMTCSVACVCTLPPSFSFLTIYCLSTAISLILWLSDSELPHICLLSQEEPEVPESSVHTPCKCCCERKISGWRDRRREGETGGKEGTCGRERFTWTLDAVKPEAEKPFCVFSFFSCIHTPTSRSRFISHHGEESTGNSCGLYLQKDRGQTLTDTKQDGKWVPCVTVTAVWWIWWTCGSVKVVVAHLHASKLYVL